VVVRVQVVTQVVEVRVDSSLLKTQNFPLELMFVLLERVGQDKLAHQMRVRLVAMQLLFVPLKA
jgi:hypothetical protein